VANRPHLPRLRAARREGERVSPLELFFDLVFVLAITQCTALMADEPTWEGLAKGLLVLAALWWAWVGYSWLTSVVDPEEDDVRFVLFGSMAAMLIVALAVPLAFEDDGLAFAIAYGVVRAFHIGLFVIASRDDPAFRRSTLGLAVGSAIGVSLLVTASFFDGWVQGALWLLAIVLDVAEPYVFGAEGWHLVPEHFAERHMLILIVALGESIVAIGIGTEPGLDAGVIVAAVLGIAIACALWWAYFDVVALVAVKLLGEKGPGRDQNEMARDSYSYLHFPMIAGIVLLALGLKKTLGHVDEPLGTVGATALAGGVALYFLAHLAFRWRNVHSLSRPRLVLAAVLLAAIPVGREVDAIVLLAVVAVAVWALIAFERTRYAAFRAEIRHRFPTAEAAID
jgi:low temperature requirement protein LtrA